jgi:hypothetical protein
LKPASAVNSANENALRKKVPGLFFARAEVAGEIINPAQFSLAEMVTARHVGKLVLLVE